MKKLHAGFLAFAFLALASATGLAQPGNLSSWKVIAEGGADVEIALAAAPPSLNKQNTNALQITVKQNGTTIRHRLRRHGNNEIANRPMV